MCTLLNNPTKLCHYTKLRRGMIPKDKEGEFEHWVMGENPCVTALFSHTTLVNSL